jgi:hypothetical protein
MQVSMLRYQLRDEPSMIVAQHYVDNMDCVPKHHVVAAMPPPPLRGSPPQFQ